MPRATRQRHEIKFIALSPNATANVVIDTYVPGYPVPPRIRSLRARKPFFRALQIRRPVINVIPEKITENIHSDSSAGLQECPIQTKPIDDAVGEAIPIYLKVTDDDTNRTAE